MSIRSAITHSVNVVAVKVLFDIGIDYMAAYGYKLGLTSPIQRFISSALGASDVSLQDLSRVFGTFANYGRQEPMIMITKIVDKNGRVLEENKPGKPQQVALPTQEERDQISSEDFNAILYREGQKIRKENGLRLTDEELKILYGRAIRDGYTISPQTAYLMVNLLTDVVRRGTGYTAHALKRPAAGKTGTTNDETDCWFMGFTPELLAGAWVGYDSKKRLGYRMTGGKVAAPIWLSYMQKALKDKPVQKFEPPENLNMARIDSLSGGSAIFSSRHVLDLSDEAFSTGEEDSASRGIEFLYGY